MLNNPGPLLDNLDKMREENPEFITHTYQKVFGMPEGQLILMDLLDKFFEFKPTSNDREAGAHGVMIYIKNRIYGVTEPKQSTGDQL